MTLNNLLEEAKLKYPVGTYLRHKTNPWLLIEDISKFKIDQTYGENIVYGDYFVYYKGEWCEIVTPIQSFQYLSLNHIKYKNLSIIEIKQNTSTFGDYFDVWLYFNGFKIQTQRFTKDSILQVFEITEQQFYDLIRLTE